MLKTVKNLVLYDIPPDDSNNFLANPGKFLKRLLFDTGYSQDEDDVVDGARVEPEEADLDVFTRNNRILSMKPKTSSKKGSSAGSTRTGRSSSGSGSGSSRISQMSLATSGLANHGVRIVDDGHPLGLGNQKILQSIFAHLPVSDLLLLRQVNLRWNIAACSVLRRKLPCIKFPPSKLRPFRKLMEKSISNPVGSFALRIDSVWDKETSKFLSRFAPDMLRLRVRLNLCEFPEFSKRLQKMRNLKELHLIVFEERHDNSEGYLSAILHGKRDSWTAGSSDILEQFDPDGWKLGLYKFPKLEKLVLEGGLQDGEKIHPFYDVLVERIILASGGLQQVRFLRWESPLGRIMAKFGAGVFHPGILDCWGKQARAEELTRLVFSTGLGASLHKVRLEVGPQVSFELVADILHKLSETLVELSLWNENIFEKFAISSKLQRLLRLNLTNWAGPVDFVYFSKQFPSLRQVHLNLSNLYEIESDLVDVSKVEPCIGVRTLSLMRLETGVDAELLGKLSRMFPKVEELFVEVKNGKALQKIYEVYPELRLLCVESKTGSENDHNQTDSEEIPEPEMGNEHFTGIPDEVIEVIVEKPCGCPVLQFPEEARGCWNIGCLKNLRTLLIRVPNSVNNIALLEGLTRLESLENLVLLPFYCHEESPTKWCLLAIADNFPRLKTLVTSTEVEYSPEELGYLAGKLTSLCHRRKP